MEKWNPNKITSTVFEGIEFNNAINEFTKQTDDIFDIYRAFGWRATYSPSSGIIFAPKIEIRSNTMELYDKAIEYYGTSEQKIVAMEEMAELQKELSKDMRGEDNLKHISEEMADVEIMLEQLKLIYENRYQVSEWKNAKRKRLAERVHYDEYSTRFLPKNGEHYYFILNGFTHKILWTNSDSDRNRYKHGNCYRTQEEADYAAEKDNVIAKLKDFALDCPLKSPKDSAYIITYDWFNKDVTAIRIAGEMKLGEEIIKFPSSVLAERAIERVGEDRVAKYYLGVEE